MKVAIVSHTGNYPVDVGGPQAVSYHLARKLAEMGEGVTLSLRFASLAERERWNMTAEARALQELGVVVSPFIAKYSLASAYMYPWYIMKGAGLLDHSRVDLVHFNSPPVDATVRLPSKLRNSGTPLTLAIHGGLIYESRNFVGRYLLRRSASKFGAVVTPNGFSKELAVKSGFAEEKVKIIPNGVETKLLGELEAERLEGTPSVFFAGRLEEVKGVRNLIEATRRLRPTLPGLKVYVAGSGSLEAFVRRSQKELSPNLVYLGKLPTVIDVAKCIKGADIFVLPSLVENFSISLLEAMACGRATLVVSDAQGNLRAVSESEAWIFQRQSPGSLAQSIRNAWENGRESRAKAQAARQKAETLYDWNIVARLYLDLFRQVVSAT